MMKRIKPSLIQKELNILYPNAHCELKHNNAFELLIAVILSAQTTDIRVNECTEVLFKKYKNAKKLAEADIKDVERIIKPIGMYHNKANSIINTSRSLLENFHGEVPCKREELESLPGVGRKTANVVLSNCFDYPAFAVDTHVSRVSKRLGLANFNDDVNIIEKKLNKAFKKEDWSKLHHQFIFFGRYTCKAKKPCCVKCPFIGKCNKED